MRAGKVKDKFGKLKRIGAIISATATAGIIITSIVQKSKRKKGVFGFLK